MYMDLKVLLDVEVMTIIVLGWRFSDVTGQRPLQDIHRSKLTSWPSIIRVTRVIPDAVT